jgi:hypothetical protein
MQATGYNLPPGCSELDVDEALSDWTDADVDEAYSELMRDAQIEDGIRERLNGAREWPPL